MDFSNNVSANKKDVTNNYYNYPLNSDIPIGNSINDECPKDNLRNQNNRLNSQNINKEKEDVNLKNHTNEIKEIDDKEHFSNNQKKIFN